MYEILKYVDEIDKSYGMAGMAIALLACDGEHFIATMSIEDGEAAIEFTPEAFFSNNPRFSAKIVWNQMMKEYHIYSGMLLGNVVCRYILSHKDMNRELIDLIHRLISEHGQQKCSLDKDEIDSLFDKDYRYFHRLFNHPAVNEVARDFANTIRIQRRMTAGDVLENLRRLSSF